MSLRPEIPAHVRHVAHPHQTVAVGDDDGIAELIEPFDISAAAQVEPALARVHRASGNIARAIDHRLMHLNGGDASLGQACEVQFHAQLALGQALDLHVLDGVDALQPVLEVFRGVLQRLPGRALGDDAKLHDVHQTRIDALHLDPGDPFREVGA